MFQDGSDELPNAPQFHHTHRGPRNHEESPTISKEYDQTPPQTQSLERTAMSHGTRLTLYPLAITPRNESQVTFQRMTGPSTYRSWCRTHRTVQLCARHNERVVSHPNSHAKQQRSTTPHAPLRFRPFKVPPVSRTVELSLQSSFQLSLMVLVYYRTRVVFSLGWSLPPNSGCIPKQPYSRNSARTHSSVHTGLTPSLGLMPQSCEL